ncbi:unnamed protein product [Gongylonema pulchrum]|uniref:Secreted protein n=1 Tax=Gongylonema pulchrum TaxID=637853 RepID=A0A183D7G0_9BILA|nr:unnamed protein product [Gongylonema pulchrum]
MFPIYRQIFLHSAAAARADAGAAAHKGSLVLPSGNGSVKRSPEGNNDDEVDDDAIRILDENSTVKEYPVGQKTTAVISKKMQTSGASEAPHRRSRWLMTWWI